MILLAEQTKSDLFLRGGVWVFFFFFLKSGRLNLVQIMAPNVSVGTADAVKTCATRLRINAYGCV